MATIERQRVLWTGFTGQPGVSTLYFNAAATAQGDVDTLLATLVNAVPLGVTLQLEANGDQVDVATGAIVGTWIGAPTAAHTSVTPMSYPAPVGAQIQWLTGGIVARRRVRGRTFVVPCKNDKFGPDGTLDNGFVTALITAAQALVSSQALNFKVWSRPQLAEAAFTDGRGHPHLAKPARAGSEHDVLGARVPDKAVILRSRRD